ncbi:MAG: hypothetical protein MPJ50_19240 [Pirellulales bacterium]|nr:hypothetical protein [Pirellulales bacterium]
MHDQRDFVTAHRFRYGALLVGVAQGQLAKLTVRQAEKLGRERFWKIPPAVETLVEAPLDFTIHAQLEGEWQIVAGNSHGRSIVQDFPSIKDRTVYFQGNQMHVPRFGSFGVAVQWQSLRFLINSKTKMVHCFQDGVDQVSVVRQPEQLILQGDSLFLQTAGWELKRIEQSAEGLR